MMTNEDISALAEDLCEEDSGSEHEPFLEQSLGIDFDLVKGYDPKNAPSNGHEYLFSVIDEARKCPRVIVSDLPRDKLKKKQNVYVVADSLPQVLSAVLPSMAWQTTQVVEFVKAREAFERIKAENDFSSTNPFKSLGAPDGDDSAVGLDDDFEDPALVKKTLYNEDYSVRIQPQTSIVASLPQSSVERLIKIHGDWMEEGTPVEVLGGWLYALLAALEIPLDPDTCSTIRSVAKTAHSLRASKSEDDPVIVLLNLLICIIGRYFRQYDLADP